MPDDKKELTEIEKLRGSLAYFRHFARGVTTLVRDPYTLSHRKRLQAIYALVESAEHQWPDWLEDGIEGKTQEELDKEVTE